MFCLPVAVHYALKSRKSCDKIKRTFTEQIRLIQMCKNCISKTEDVNLILKKDKYLVCKRYCTDCSNCVCESCSIKRQTGTNPCLIACDYCLQNNFCSKKRAVLVITVDRESGNKQCLKQINPYLSLLSILPDVSHVLKNCKESFSN